MIQTLFGSVEQEPTLLEKLKSGVQKTREGLVSRIEDVISGKKQIDADLLEELEYTLISADIGVATTEEILERIRERVDRKLVGDSAELRGLIREYLLEVLAGERASPGLRGRAARGDHGGRRERGGEDHHHRQTRRRFKSEGRIRAAVRRRYVPRRRHRAAGNLGRAHRHAGDPAEAGRRPERRRLRCPAGREVARKVDYVIVDTAGRLQTKDEPDGGTAKRCAAPLRSVIPDAPHEVLLVLDATTGQNGLEQARKFTETSGVTGIVLTKLDGTAKGGIVVAIARELDLPIRSSALARR